jgi:hypothetical protein
MKFGKIEENEKIIKFNLELKCTNCNKKVPGGMKSSENYFETIEFNKELEKFKKTYLCGVCRDKKRIKDQN